MARRTIAIVGVIFASIVFYHRIIGKRHSLPTVLSRWLNASFPGSLPTWHRARPTSQSAASNHWTGPLTGR